MIQMPKIEDRIEDPKVALDRVRREVSSAVGLVETAFGVLLSKRPDPKAFDLHAVGVQKLRNALMELDLMKGRLNESAIIKASDNKV